MFERRLQVLLLFLALFCAALVVRAVALQVVGRSYWEAQSIDTMRNDEQLPTTRGRILDVNGHELAVDEPCIDGCVDYRAITFDPDALWVRAVARKRVKLRVDNYSELSLSTRKQLLEAETVRVRADIVSMWHDLARLSNQTNEQMDEIRRQVIRQVETRRRIVWYRKYKNAAASQPTDSHWYDWLVGTTQVSLDNFDVHVAEETQPQVILPHIDYALRTELARNIDHYPGLKLRAGVMRVYPYGSVACQTIGRLAPVTPDDMVNDPLAADALGKYEASDRIGRVGMEKLFDIQLRGKRGLRVTDDDGNVIKEIPPEPGHDVRTSIDIDLQKDVEQFFKTVWFAVNSKIGETLDMPGAAVIIDLPTGQVRTLASWPTYDLNKFDELYATLSKDYINRPLANRALTTAAEPGSTVKPIIGIGAITSGVFKPNETVHCEGYLMIGGHKYPYGRCWTVRLHPPETHQSMGDSLTGDLTFPEALKLSCNVFHETVGLRLGIGGISFWFDKFGLGRPTGIGLPEAKGLLPDRLAVSASRQFGITTSAAIGEGYVAATPIQMANVAATIARNGIWMKPTLLADEKSAPVDLHLNPTAVAEAQLGMRLVANDPRGTGRVVKLDNLVVAAKTGSAQTSPLSIMRRNDDGTPMKDANGKILFDVVKLGTHDAPNPIAPWYRAIGDDQDTIPAHAWMIGFAPADHPKIAIAVYVEHGGGGGTAAGSVLKRAFESCIQHGYLTPDK